MGGLLKSQGRSPPGLPLLARLHVLGAKPASMRSNCALECFLRPRIETFSFCFRKHGRLRMNAGINAQHDLAGIRTLRGIELGFLLRMGPVKRLS